jgi:predicted kinase
MLQDGARLKEPPVLIIFGGLPAVGKTVIARELARQIGAAYLRIDSIEQAMRDSNAVSGPLNDTGYRVAYAVAEENLRLGHTVVADSVNPIALTRDAWRDVARRVGVRAIEIEVRCSDPEQHRRRVETRVPDIAGWQLPTWSEVLARKYHPWDRDHLVIDSAVESVQQSVLRIREKLRS